VDEEINEKLELSISDVKVITLLSKYYCEWYIYTIIEWFYKNALLIAA
jgi:hypothetical protein